MLVDYLCNHYYFLQQYILDLVDELDLSHCDQPIHQVDQIHLHVDIGRTGNFQTPLKFFHHGCDYVPIPSLNQSLKSVSLLPFLPLLNALQYLEDVISYPLPFALSTLSLDVIGLVLVGVVGLEEGELGYLEVLHPGEPVEDHSECRAELEFGVGVVSYVGAKPFYHFFDKLQDGRADFGVLNRLKFIPL